MASATEEPSKETAAMHLEDLAVNPELARLEPPTSAPLHPPHEPALRGANLRPGPLPG